MATGLRMESAGSRTSQERCRCVIMYLSCHLYRSLKVCVKRHFAQHDGPISSLSRMKVSQPRRASISVMSELSMDHHDTETSKGVGSSIRVL